MNTECLGCKNYSHTLHDGSTIHVDGRTQRNSKGRNLLGYADFFGQRINRHRNGRIRRCSRKCECHNREKFLDEPNRIQTCKDLEQDLIYAETLNSQCQQYTDHILRQRDKCTETDIRKCTADQTEYTDWGKAHDHHGHFHHDIIKLAEEVCNCLCTLAHFCKNHTDDQCKYDNLKHASACQRIDRVVRNDIQDRIGKRCCFHGFYRSCRRLNRAHIKADTRIDQITDTKRNANCHCCSCKIKYQGSHTHRTEFFCISNCHTSADQRAEYQRYNQHLHQTDKSLSNDIENTFNNYIFFETAVRNQIAEHDTKNRSRDQRDKDLGRQPYRFFVRSFCLCVFFFHFNPPFSHPCILSGTLSIPAYHTFQ